MGGRSSGWSLEIDKRTRNLICVFYHGGRRYRRSTRVRNRRQAQVEAARIYAEVTGAIEAKRRALPLGGHDLDRLLGAWLEEMGRTRREATVEIWTMHVTAHLAPFFRDAGDVLDPKRQAQYVATRLRKVTASTVRKECSTLQAFFTWCARPENAFIDQAEIPTVPRPLAGVKGTRAKIHERVDLTPELAEAIVARLPEWVRAAEAGGPRRPCRALFLLLWETGLRIGTVVRLEAPGDYEPGRATLRIRPEIDKADYGRELPLTARAREALDAVYPERPGRIFEEIDLRAQLRAAAIACGVPPRLARHLGHHDFRHARTTALVDAGAPLTGAAYLVGHKRISTTDGYVHARKKAGEEALASLAAHQTAHGASPTRSNPVGEEAPLAKEE